MTDVQNDRLTAPVFGVSRHRLATDGAGVTTLVCFHTCPLRCRYCLNPQSLDAGTQVKEYTPESLYEEVKVDNLYFLASGGGVTFGGGEPLLRMDFLERFRSLCGSAWHLYAETSLHVSMESAERAAAVFDDFIVDCKDMNGEIYQRYTGQKNDVVLANLLRLRERIGADRITVRVPLIPGYNTPEDQRRSMQKLREMGFSKFDPLEYVIRSM